MEAAVPAAKKAGAGKILEIRLKIGELSGVLPECINEYFAVISKGTIAEGAIIKVEKVPISIACSSCGFEGPVERRKVRCPACDGEDFKITGGREYFVDSIEVE